MDEVIKNLGPWPLLQGIALGVLIAASAIWAIKRGFQDRENNDRDSRQQWDAYRQLANIEANTARIVAIQERMVEAVNRMIVAWDRQQRK